MKTLFTSILLAVTFTSVSVAQDINPETTKNAAMLRDAALKSDLAYDILESITTEVGPRLAGSPADFRAQDWAVAKFNELGFDKVYKEPVKIPYWKRIHESAEVIAPFPQPLYITALGGSVSTPEGGLQAEVIQFDTVNDLAKAPAGIAKGKIVFISGRMMRHRTGKGYGMANGKRGRGPDEAAKKGAIGLVIRSVGTDSHRNPHTGGTRYSGDVTKIPAGALSGPDADQLERILKRGKPVTLKMDIKTKDMGEVTTYSVIGEITGSEAPDEIVAIGGHLDSWDLGTGAIDDGAGVAITMATAAFIRNNLEQRPRRTIRVVLFAAEEIGLYGGKQYALNRKDSMDNHIIGSESDFGAGKVWALSSKVSQNSVHVVDAMMALMSPLNVVRSSRPAGGGPDFGPMVRQGMPSIGLMQDGTKYFDLHHTPDDTFDKVSKEEMSQNMAAWSVFTYMAAEWPGRFDK